MAKNIKLGTVQSQIMAVLWRRGEATAKEITEELSQHAPIAHSTVQTLLRQLEVKEAVSHAPEARTFVFKALISPSQIAESPLDLLLNRFYGGSVVGFMAHFLKQEKVSADELRELKKLIDEQQPKDNAK